MVGSLSIESKPKNAKWCRLTDFKNAMQLHACGGVQNHREISDINYHLNSCFPPLLCTQSLQNCFPTHFPRMQFSKILIFYHGIQVELGVTVMINHCIYVCPSLHSHPVSFPHSQCLIVIHPTIEPPTSNISIASVSC